MQQKSFFYNQILISFLFQNFPNNFLPAYYLLTFQRLPSLPVPSLSYQTLFASVDDVCHGQLNKKGGLESYVDGMIIVAAKVDNTSKSKNLANKDEKIEIDVEDIAQMKLHLLRTLRKEIDKGNLKAIELCNRNFVGTKI